MEEKKQHIVWHDDVIVKQLISYAVGCMMGRYRLDKPGLHIAHPNPTDEETAAYNYNGGRFEIDDDGIMPLMPLDSPFNDNAPLRLQEFVKLVFGEERLSENLNVIESALGKSIADYFQKDFWKDHKNEKMYQNRPIYWLFASKKRAFQCIVYMHRMNAFTVSRLRTKYLLKEIEYLKQRIDNLRARQAELSVMERRQLAGFEKDLEECREYDIRLHAVADKQIAFDLDDGVKVNYAKFGDVVAKLN